MQQILVLSDDEVLAHENEGDDDGRHASLDGVEVTPGREQTEHHGARHHKHRVRKEDQLAGGLGRALFGGLRRREGRCDRNEREAADPSEIEWVAGVIVTDRDEIGEARVRGCERDRGAAENVQRRAGAGHPGEDLQRHGQQDYVGDRIRDRDDGRERGPGGMHGRPGNDEQRSRDDQAVGE